LKVLTYGYYGLEAKNLGDELFKSAFKTLFPEFSFTFTDNITADHLIDQDAVFLGGGSFLDQEPQITKEALEAMSHLPVFYIGIGAETKIHPTHQQLIKQAKLVAVRSLDNIDYVRQLNANTILIPDLVYSLGSVRNTEPINNSILFIPNANLIPKWNDSHWKHIAWSFFKNEIAQVLDELFAEGYEVDFYSMCNGNQNNDVWAADEILNATEHIKRSILPRYDDAMSNMVLFSRYSLVITQRYHGSIIAEMAGTPYITIHHHDKLKGTYYDGGCFIPYFETSKHRLLEAINNSSKQEKIAIETHLFRELVARINDAASICWI
jgi:polysaccharide pyruvyl transferase WcaK-like protein